MIGKLGMSITQNKGVIMMVVTKMMMVVIKMMMVMVMMKIMMKIK